MSDLIKLFLNILMIYLINCSSIDQHTDLKENKLEKIKLTESTTQIIFKTKPETKMSVELILSHPSHYTYTFNQYDLEEEEVIEDAVDDYEGDSFYSKFINPKRRLATDYSENQTDLIESEESQFGKNKFILDIKEDMNKIVLSIFLKDDEEDIDQENDLMFVKYKNLKNEEEENNYSYESEIKVKKDKDMLSITFGGLSDENENLENAQIVYDIKLFDKEELTSLYENYYINSYTNEVKPLYSTSFVAKGEMIKKENYLKIKAPLNDGKEQYLLINAKITNSDGEELQFLQYKSKTVTVEEQSEEREWPDDEEEEKEKEKEKEKDDEKKEEKKDESSPNNNEQKPEEKKE